MDQVFAPWRIEWVEREDDGSGAGDGCPFCRIRDAPAEDRERRVVARTARSFVLLNNYPYNPGHAMVIPRRHVAGFGALTAAERLDLATLQARTLDALDASLEPDGANTGTNLGEGAGGSLEHLHVHVVPRWTGDTNFMPVIGDTKVIVEALADTYDRLREGFAGLPDAEGGDSGPDPGAEAGAEADGGGGAVRLAFDGPAALDDGDGGGGDGDVTAGGGDGDGDGGT